MLRTISAICVLLMMLFVGYYSSLPWNIEDDFYYTYHWKYGSKLTSFWDVLSSQYYHYIDNNGRFVAHTIVQLFDGIWGQTSFAVCNAFAHLFLLWIICKLVKVRFEQTGMIILICCVLIVCLRTCLVASHQVGYIWMAALSLGYCYLFLREERKPISKWWMLLIIPFSVMAGNGQETFNIGISSALICYAIINIKRMTPIQWAMLFSFGVGVLLIILSPSLMLRVNDENAKCGSQDSIIRWITTLRMTYVLVFLLIYKCRKQKAKLIELYRKNAFWYNAFLFSVLFNLILGIYGYRQLLGIELFASCIVLLLLVKNTINSSGVVFLNVVFIVLLVSRICYVHNTINHINAIFTNIESLYLNSKTGITYFDLSRDDLSEDSFLNAEACFAVVRGPVFLNTLSSYFNKKHNINNKKLKILPTLVEHPEQLKCANYEVKCADGHWAFVVDKANAPTAILQKRHISLCGFEFPFKSKNVPMDKPIYENDSIIVFDYFESFGNITAGEVQWIYP